MISSVFLEQIGLGAMASVVIVAILTLDESPRLAPDSTYYLALAHRAPVPRPFSFRWLVPQLLGRHERTWRLATLVALVLQGVLMTALVRDWRAAVLLLALPAGARFHVRHPVSVDPVALAATLAATLMGPPAWRFGVASLVLLCMRETAPLWLAVYTRHLLPIFVLPGLWLSHHGMGRPASEADPIWVQDRSACLARRRGQWGNPMTMLLPWGVVLPLAVAAAPADTVTIWAISWVFLPADVDTARVQAWAAPALIPLALAAPVPDAWWPVLLLAHCFNPYRGA